MVVDEDALLGVGSNPSDAAAARNFEVMVEEHFVDVVIGFVTTSVG